jgi:glycosyltransferase involved in cell wall biosynthesis
MRSKNIKIIIIAVASFGKKQSRYTDVNSDEYYLASWAGLWARRLKKRNPEIDIELWRSEPDFSDVSTRIAFGVSCTIFPYKYPVVSGVITYEMLKRLFRFQNTYNLVIHITRIFDWRFNILMPRFLIKTHFVLSHLGGIFPGNYNIKNIIIRKLLMYSYNRIDVITYLRESIKRDITDKNKTIKLEFLPVGADFDYFKPLDKMDCRKKLGLPLDKIFAVYVGKFFRLKGVDHILKIYRQFKDQNFEILFVGGKENDELFSDVALSGCRYWCYVPREQLWEIYSAADFFIHPAFNSEFGGLDVSWEESLACDRPVLSPQLNELDFDHSALGIAMNSEIDMLEKTQQMINSFSNFKNCREKAILHLDGNSVIVDKLHYLFKNLPEK